MSYFFQLVVSGIVVGSIYALAALGFVLIYKSSKVLNIAHGQIIAAGAFITFALTSKIGIPVYISFLLSMAITFFLAMSVEKVFLRRLIGEPIISVIMVTIGLMSILDGLIYLTPFGTENFSFPPFLPTTPIAFGGVSISWTQLVGVMVTFSMIAGFSWFFKKSTVGISMRAVSDDQLASMSIGISVPRVFGLAWAMAGLSAAAAGGINRGPGLLVHSLQTFAPLPPAFKTILPGIGCFPGKFLGTHTLAGCFSSINPGGKIVRPQLGKCQ